MDLDSDDEDDFDWEAAVEAMENISLLSDRQEKQDMADALKENRMHNGKVTKQNAPAGAASERHVKAHQKTMLSFIHRYKQPLAEKSITIVDHEGGWSASADVDGPGGIDPVSAKTWVYPVNVPMRDYQFSIVQTALFSNTLVSLPTGLGKTLIAAVVIYNFFRWFPSGKIVFTAPSRPLVLQQIEACHDSVGISQEWTIDMTGQMNPTERSSFWKTKRVFFVTPQVLEKDIQSGSCSVQEIVCLVVDEAHRATGNYSYCMVVRKFIEASVRLRILALTATPGSKQATIQAVVDNLRISCLEYRSESDSDVRQYVHTRKIELLQVDMDAESITIKDIFLEVLQPLVNKLCGFGVFYSRDAARLTPYEFLTARDKFRQAPPSGLDQRQFAEVEACFGAIITLYHIFKLLFSHGIRPAFEMLKQKLQSGPFARLMGRNEKLHQIKIMMQKHVGNGASSPKLLKMQELISNHFKEHDPTKTRVIIFTNFRESVKDILESLRKLGDIVKAMEFIGQSSGRNSKGQSQKMQQSVLQKFRGGGFNTIVATSIAEEGLDIMEVDLVICFDANISPLRMIQRMGRTGRKRDGRVIVLASEGAEIQGYLKKQAKNKVLGKHMYNGGLRSFNFHSSPRMVPHSFKPELQLVELSITKFVPRVKGKQKVVQVLDPGVLDLTVEELLTLRKYTQASRSPPWRPSLISFPHCQLLPTRVHKIRHSLRTVSMLIDTMQSLQERKHDFQASGVAEGAMSGQLSDWTGKLEVDNMKEHTPVSSPTKETSHTDNLACEFQTSVLSSLLGNADCVIVLDSKDMTPMSKAPEITCNFVEEKACSSTAGWMFGPETEETYCGKNLGKDLSVFHPSESDKEEDQPSHLGEQDAFRTPILKRHEDTYNFSSCDGRSNMLSGRIVSVDAAGYVQITLPPTLLSMGDCQFDDRASTVDIKEIELQNKVNLSPLPQLQSQRARGQLHINHESPSPPFDDEIIALPSTGMPVNGLQHIVSSTPLENILRSSRALEGNTAEFDDDDSPRLCSLAELGIVPSSPCLNNSSFQKECEIAETNALFSHFSLNAQRKEVAIAGLSCFSPGIGDHELASTEKVVSPPIMATAPSKNRKRLDKDLQGAVNEFDGLQKNTCAESMQSRPPPICLDEERMVPCPTGVNTPLCQPSTKSSSDNWRLSLEATSSSHKSRKLKRLRKVKNKLTKERLLSSGEKGRPKGLISGNRLGKRQLRLAAAMLIEEEAEVSSDELISADEDEWEDEGSLEEFIDDRVEPTAVTQQDCNEPIDMMAVYRKSLLTQSPFVECMVPWGRVNRSHCTPLSDSVHSLSSKSSECKPSESSKSSHDFIMLPCTSSATPVLEGKENELVCIDSNSRHVQRFESNGGAFELSDTLQQSVTRIQDRKRKLSFQQQVMPPYMQVAVTHTDFDDDLFTGIDLDALEVEAAQMSRSHLQENLPQPSTASGMQGGVPICKDAVLHDDDDFECFPSFNLGFDS